MTIALGPNHPDHGTVQDLARPAQRVCAAAGCTTTFTVERTHPEQRFCSLVCSATGRSPYHQQPAVRLRKRLVADRFRRIWHIVEDIAETPGKSRRNLADKFHLSERQVQADLTIIRTDMRLPLIRRQGYRFIAEGVGTGGEGCFDLREAQLLVMILRQSMKDRSIPDGRLRSLMRKLPAMFPAHLQPLVERTLEAVTAPPTGQQEQVFAALADALLRGSWVTLIGQPGTFEWPIAEPIIQPELLLPYLDSWYVVGRVQQRNRSMMLRLDVAAAVTLAAVPS